MKDIVKLLVSVVVCLAAGFIGSIFTNANIPTWYAALKKPSFAPPNWVFAPVWTALFVLMGIAVYLVWRQGFNTPVVKTALIIFIVQLIFNMLWSLVFFTLKSPLFGFVVIIILWFLILATIIYFSNVSKVAGILLVPYIVWVSFASILNFMLWRLNL
jgi:translocator protein